MRVKYTELRLSHLIICLFCHLVAYTVGDRYLIFKCRKHLTRATSFDCSCRFFTATPSLSAVLLDGVVPDFDGAV